MDGVNLRKRDSAVEAGQAAGMAHADLEHPHKRAIDVLVYFVLTPVLVLALIGVSYSTLASRAAVSDNEKTLVCLSGLVSDLTTTLNQRANITVLNNMALATLVQTEAKALASPTVSNSTDYLAALTNFLHDNAANQEFLRTHPYLQIGSRPNCKLLSVR